MYLISDILDTSIRRNQNSDSQKFTESYVVESNKEAYYKGFLICKFRKFCSDITNRKALKQKSLISSFFQQLKYI